MRVDHILVSNSVNVQSGSSKSWPDFARPNRGADHHPIALQVFPPIRSCSTHFRRRTVQYNRAATQEPERAQRFQELVDNISRPHYAVEPTTHGWLLKEAVRHVAVEAFGPPLQRTTKQSYVDSHGMQLIARRRRELSRAHYAGILMKRAAAKATFIAWARRRSVLKRRSTLEFVQPWVLQMRVQSMIRAKSL